MNETPSSQIPAETPPMTPPMTPTPAVSNPQPVQPPPVPTPTYVPTLKTPDESTEVEPSGLRTVVMGTLSWLFNWVIIPIGLVLILHNFVFQAFHVVGSSMVPTLHQSDYLIISKLGQSEAQVSKLFGKGANYVPKPGEVVVFHYPRDPSLVFVKRVIGIPGDRVVVQDGKVTVFNTQHPDGYDPVEAVHATLASDVTLGTVDEIIPVGSIFVVGDNRTPGGSYDSREWGLLPSSYIIGKAVMRLLPVSSARFLNIVVPLPPLITQP